MALNQIKKAREASQPPPQVSGFYPAAIHTESGQSPLEAVHEEEVMLGLNGKSSVKSKLPLGHAKSEAKVNQLRRVRSKSPQHEDMTSGRNYFALKVKKYYRNMVPAFTNKKRQHAYFNALKQGFNYINKDMESELYVFQSQIE